MRAVKSKNTAPEILVRKLVHAMGFRFRLHSSALPGSPDIVLPKHKKVIFVHGCFWHQHRCSRGNRVPKANKNYWANKLRRNKERDSQSLRLLRRKNWKTLVVWECQLAKPDKLHMRLAAFLANDP